MAGCHALKKGDERKRARASSLQASILREQSGTRGEERGRGRETYREAQWVWRCTAPSVNARVAGPTSGPARGWGLIMGSMRTSASKRACSAMAARNLCMRVHACRARARERRNLQGRPPERVPDADQGARRETVHAAGLGGVSGEPGEVRGELEVERGRACGEVVQKEVEYVAGVVLPVDSGRQVASGKWSSG